MAESSRYVIQFDPYQGAEQGKPCWGLVESVVFRLAESLPRGNRQHMKKDTMFQNKLNKCNIIAPKELLKKVRGYIDQETTTDKSLKIVGWNDNKAAFVASNMQSHHQCPSLEQSGKENHKGSTTPCRK